jgi:hypothetical protein
LVEIHFELEVIQMRPANSPITRHIAEEIVPSFQSFIEEVLQDKRSSLDAELAAHTGEFLLAIERDDDHGAGNLLYGTTSDYYYLGLVSGLAVVGEDMFNCAMPTKAYVRLPDTEPELREGNWCPWGNLLLYALNERVKFEAPRSSGCFDQREMPKALRLEVVIGNTDVAAKVLDLIMKRDLSLDQVLRACELLGKTAADLHGVGDMAEENEAIAPTGRS